jgi:regulator of protease activity HflC (stomatin/prohibitin superfamily)
VEKSFFPVLLLWAVLLWGFTMVHEVGPNNVGVREQFGKAMTEEILTPGVYWTLPYPFGTIRQFSCTEVRTVVIGENEKHDEAEVQPIPVVLWTNEHGGAKAPFLMAVKDNDDNRNSGASVSFINMAIPITYSIRPDGVIKYAYGNVNPDVVLKKVGEQALITYLAGMTIEEFIGAGRGDAETVLRREIQYLADQNELGIEIINVSILDAHPPVEQVAPAYQEEVAAIEVKETEILKAIAYAKRLEQETAALVFTITKSAESRKNTVTTLAKAESERFSQQRAAFKAMPAMFILNAQMDVWESEGANVNKYVVPEELEDMVYQINFENKERLDLIDIDSSELTDKK